MWIRSRFSSIIAQVFVAGFAAEHILTGRREFDREIGFAILACAYPSFATAFPDADTATGTRL